MMFLKDPTNGGFKDKASFIRGFYAFPAGLTLEGAMNYKKACSHISNLISTSMRKVRIITIMLVSYLDPIFKP